MWGSARLMDMVSVNPGTLPTCRGGLPGAYLSALKIHLFSPHAWGSVPQRVQPRRPSRVFPTTCGGQSFRDWARLTVSGQFGIPTYGQL